MLGLKGGEKKKSYFRKLRTRVFSQHRIQRGNKTSVEVQDSEQAVHQKLIMKIYNITLGNIQ
jgi:hypothetical protein